MLVLMKVLGVIFVMKMSKVEFYQHLADILEIDQSLIADETNFRDIESWDSLAVITFVAFVDDKFNIIVDAENLEAAHTFSDLASLANL
jgi:acyl carrier protein